MSVIQSSLLTEVEKFLAETGMGASYFGKRAVRNGDLVSRLRRGRRVWPDTEAKVRAFIMAEREIARRTSHGCDRAPRKGATQ